MNSRPKVSFCFTTFKRFDYLRDTLKSVQNQTFSDFEVVVSDNDPQQSGRAVVESFDHRFNYFPNEENLGMKKSFNKSLERSSGEFIVMIADDDPVYPDMLETLLNLEKKYPGHGMYLGGCNWFCTDPDLADFYNCKVGVNSCLAHRPINEVQEFSAEEFLSNFFNFKIFPNYLWSCAIVKRDVMVDMGGVPDYGTAFLGDYAYMSIMGGHSGCVTINKALGHQTLHKENFGRAQNEQLVFLGPHFLDYVSSKLSKLNNWPAIRTKMEHFVAVWIVRHTAFLKTYSKAVGDMDNVKDIENREKGIFNIPFMKPYKVKYYLLTHFPALHDKAVQWKAKLKK
jgi:glycosyltransferase involved in cell wall biosynthesis